MNNSIVLTETNPFNFSNSLFQKSSFKGLDFWIKRDDLIHPIVNGNKARKLYFLDSQNLLHYNKIVSTGGNQSNMIAPMSYLARVHNIPFEYYTSKLSSYLATHLDGNLKQALDFGMRLYEHEMPTHDTKSLYIPIGGEMKEAELGIALLAQELEMHIIEHQVCNPLIFLVSGTGTTYAYLRKNTTIPVITISALTHKTYRFAKPHIRLLELYQQLLDETGIEFDLIYDCVGWDWLLANKELFAEYNLIFIHQGGLLGNQTQLPRYSRLIKGRP